MKNYPSNVRYLDETLILRRSTPQDREPLAEFNARIHADTDQPDQKVAAWTRDLLSGTHPTFGVDDFTIVEDTSTGKIISATNLISQTWSFAGIPFKVGRPELVGTDPEFRNRGLIRAQFDEIHRWSKERGEVLQAITGIPHYYRQFGYEMCTHLDGWRAGYAPQVPQLEKDTSESYLFRPAQPQDAAFIAALYQQGCQRQLLACQMDETLFRYFISGQDPQNVNRLEYRIIETLAGERIGFVAHPGYNWGNGLFSRLFELKQGTPWLKVTPALIRYLWKTGEEYARAEEKERTCFGFAFDENHPANDVARERLPRIRKPYNWYLRLPNIPAFLNLVRPVLEQRLANSPCVGFSGELKLSFFRSGVRLEFNEGRLQTIEPWQPQPTEWGSATYTGLSFLQVLFGYRTQEELEDVFVDCWSNQDVKPVLRALFPRLPSLVLPVS